jgi:hypothetical protein
MDSCTSLVARRGGPAPAADVDVRGCWRRRAQLRGARSVCLKRERVRACAHMRGAVRVRACLRARVAGCGVLSGEWRVALSVECLLRINSK